MTTAAGDQTATILFFRTQLLEWGAQAHRPLPWKGERDPYKIWLSEIILQQTRAEQGRPYYEKLLARYPSVLHLADAPEDELLKNWEGLGYYSRARNLHTTARQIAYEYKGKFPEDYETVRALKGVGDYTAAAIVSFAYNLPYAVVDGNVYRVLSRYFGVDTPTDTPAGKKIIQALANSALDPYQAAAFNQALMDFGAMQCTPQQANCAVCPMKDCCVAHREGKVYAYPVKSKKAARQERNFLYYVFRCGPDVFIRRRTDKDIWKGLYEFPALEPQALPPDLSAAIELLRQSAPPESLPDALSGIALSAPYRQILTHRTVNAVFCEAELPPDYCEAALSRLPFSDLIRVKKTEIKKKFAIPRLIDWYLQEKSVTLRLF